MERTSPKTLAFFLRLCQTAPILQEDNPTSTAIATDPTRCAGHVPYIFPDLRAQGGRFGLTAIRRIHHRSPPFAPCTPPGWEAQGGKEPRGLLCAWPWDPSSGLVELRAGRWGAPRGAGRPPLGLPQVVVAEVALEALQLGVVVVGRGAAARAALGQVVSAAAVTCRKAKEELGELLSAPWLPAPSPAGLEKREDVHESPHVPSQPCSERCWGSGGGCGTPAAPEGLTWWLQQGAQMFLWQG